MRWVMPEECASRAPSIFNARIPEHSLLTLRRRIQTHSVWVAHGDAFAAYPYILMSQKRQAT